MLTSNLQLHQASGIHLTLLAWSGAPRVYAAQGPDIFSLDLLFATVRPAETSQLSVHLRPGVPVTEERVFKVSVSHEGPLA